jgi:hypothetical protein
MRYSAAAPTLKLELSSARRPFLAKTGEYGEDPGDLAEEVVTTEEMVACRCIICRVQGCGQVFESSTPSSEVAPA